MTPVAMLRSLRRPVAVCGARSPLLPRARGGGYSVRCCLLADHAAAPGLPRLHLAPDGQRFIARRDVR